MRFDLQVSRPRQTIGLTPLIDVVFILLLFFLVASNFQKWGAFALNAPGHPISEAGDGETPVILVRVHQDGRLDLNGAPHDPLQLRNTLEMHRARHPDLEVVLQSDAEVELQPLVSAMDIVVAAGVKALNLQ